MFRMEIESLGDEFCPAIIALKKTSEINSKKITDLESAASNASGLNTTLEMEVKRLSDELKAAPNRCDSLEGFSRRNNLQSWLKTLSPWMRSPCWIVHTDHHVQNPEKASCPATLFSRCISSTSKWRFYAMPAMLQWSSGDWASLSTRTSPPRWQNMSRDSYETIHMWSTGCDSLPSFGWPMMGKITTSTLRRTAYIHQHIKKSWTLLICWPGLPN